MFTERPYAVHLARAESAQRFVLLLIARSSYLRQAT
jgi:hypothetical protein